MTNDCGQKGEDCLFELSRGDSIGLAFVAQSGFISLAAVLTIFLLIGRNVLLHIWKPPPGPWRLIRGPVDAYMLSLFVSDLLQALGAVLDIKWVRQGFVESGRFCTAQGAIQQIGEASVAITTLVIALHTFISVTFHKGTNSRIVAYVVIGLIWAFVLSCTLVGARIHSENFEFQPTPYWCWINGNFLAERIVGEYLWLWLALIGSTTLYVPLFLWMNGNITVHKEDWKKMRLHLFPAVPQENERPRPKANALAMLAYPMAYSVVVLPLSVVRWVGFAQEAHGPNRVPPSATFSVTFLFGLSGFVNVLLLLSTRPNLLLFGRVKKSRVASSVSEGTETPFQLRRLGSKTGEAVIQNDHLNMSSDSGWNLPNA